MIPHTRQSLFRYRRKLQVCVFIWCEDAGDLVGDRNATAGLGLSLVVTW